jgi:transcriptional regulator with XRE-family HTH domain
MLGEELRKEREMAGLTQEQLSFRSGLSRPYISQLERELKSPTLETLFLLCDALSISAAELVGRVEVSRKHPTRESKP